MDTPYWKYKFNQNKLNLCVDNMMRVLLCCDAQTAYMTGIESKVDR